MNTTIHPKSILFGTAGTPIQSKDRGSLKGVEVVRELGLDCMELEFVRGVRMSPELAKQVGEAAEKNNVLLTAHGPYYINLNSQESQKVKDSVRRILDTAKIADIAGAYSITFHAAFFMGQDPVKVYDKVRDRIKDIVKTLQDKGIGLWVRPETTGKMTQLGSLKETIKLSQDVEQVLPCVDFAHLHARTGKLNSHREFCDILTEIEKGLGREALNNMHIHMSGINYSPKGERNHLILKESDFKYRELMKAFKEFRIKGPVISESPNIEADALLMKKTYESI
ncbi:TIM barrel protein [Candidatus Woesearchaeota archaeon]|nr:TIM barrel protein [Candidatus Woesearchaeota archaeon]